MTINQNIVPLGNRDMRMLPHPKRVLNENQLDVGLTEFGGSLAHMMPLLMDDEMPTDQIITNLKGDSGDEEFYEAWQSYQEPHHHAMLLEEILCAFRFQLHHGDIVSLSQEVADQVKSLSLKESAHQFSLFEKEFTRYFYLEHQLTSASDIWLPNKDPAKPPVRLEGFYCMQYGQPHEVFREIHLMLIGSAVGADGCLNKCAYPVQLHITNEQRPIKDVILASVDKLLLRPTQYALKTLYAYRKHHQEMQYSDEHDQVRGFSSLNRDHRMKRTYNHYLMDNH